MPAANAATMEEQDGRRRSRYRKIAQHGKAPKGCEHEDLAVGEIDHEENAVDQGISQGDERVDTPDVRPFTT